MSPSAENGQKDSRQSRAVGKQWTENIKIRGVPLVAIIDTGAQVTTIRESWFRQNLSDLVETYRFDVKLGAANGDSLPTIGCFETDLLVGKYLVEDTVIVITKDVGNSQPDCLLGTNVLGRIPQFVPRLKECINPSSSKLLRAPAGGLLVQIPLFNPCPTLFCTRIWSSLSWCRIPHKTGQSPLTKPLLGMAKLRNK